MMYQIGFTLYILLFRLVALRHKKAKKMVQGHRSTWNVLQSEQLKDKHPIWFHAASLGEFEQGRPLIERIRKEQPEKTLLLTFYSPSGYEVRKNYEGVDRVLYLPFDTKHNVRRFLNAVQPEMVFFIKYEFWPNYLTQLRRRGIPTYLISGIFRDNQLFFRPYGGFYRRLLTSFHTLFVQNDASFKRLSEIGQGEKTIVAGDTRYDRVLDVKREAQSYEIMETFQQEANRQSSVLLIAGSTWPEDEQILLPFINQQKQLRLVIAPHQIDEGHLKQIESQLNRKTLRYSRANTDNITQAEVLLIDSFGMLSSLYRYGKIAYIGGGFGAGIHNTLEAAVYSIPVLFGPKHQKFNEARMLLEAEGGFCIKNETDFQTIMLHFLHSEADRQHAGDCAGRLVKQSSGGTDLIYNRLFDTKS